MKHKHFVSLAFLLFTSVFFTSVQTQTIVDGYVFEANNQGYLNQVKVTVFELPDNIVRGEVETSLDGHFVFSLPEGKYRVLANKDIFFENYDTINLGNEMVFLKMELLRRPDDLFEASKTKAHESPDKNVDTIFGATIEGYNQTTRQEVLEKSKNNKPKSNPKRLQEANTSVPLPEFKPTSDDFSERGETAAPAPSPRQLSDSKHARPFSDIDQEGVRILQLPPTFKGCAIELARSEADLPSNHPAFKGQKEVFRLLENDGKFTYLLANLGTREIATAFFKKKIKPVNRTAKLVRYTETGKEYLSE